VLSGPQPVLMMNVYAGTERVVDAAGRARASVPATFNV
jgi:hypothetical protein